MTIIPTLPDTAEELEAALNDPAFIKAHYSDNETAAKSTIAIAAKIAERDKGEIKAQVQAQVDAELVKILKENGYVPGRPDAGQPLGAKTWAPGGKEYRGWESDLMANYQGPLLDMAAISHRWAEFGDATVNARRQELAQIRAAYSSEVGHDGGFLIPKPVADTLRELAIELSVVRPRATILPMTSKTLTVPRVDATTHVGSLFGGVIAYWVGEGATNTESSAEFGTMELEAKKLAAYTTVPNETMADVTAMNALFNGPFPKAMAYQEDESFLTGNGVIQPLGVLNAPATVTVAAEGGQAANTILWENLANMWARLLPESQRNAIWVVNQETFPQLATMSLSVGTGGSAIWLNNAVDGPPMSILGRPVITTEKVPALGTKGDINLIDFGHYLIGDRQSIMVDSSPHVEFPQDKTAFRAVSRVDGRPWLTSALTPRNGSNTLSPFVSLATRA